MQTYNCPSCISQFSETDKEWVDLESGFCPACQMPLRNFHLHAQELNQEKAKGKDQVDAAARLTASMVPPNASPLDSTPAANAAAGVRGWLYLLILGLLVLSPLFSASQIFLTISAAGVQYPSIQLSPQWASFKVLTWSVYVALAGLSMYGGWGLFRGREWSVVTRAMLVLWVSGPIGIVLMGVLVPLIIFGRWNESIDGKFIGALIGSIMIASMWTVYLSNSKRVRATYAPTGQLR